MHYCIKNAPILTLLLVPLMFSSYAHAYVGPGAGLSLIGSVVGLLSTVFFAVFMIVYVPIKKARNKKRQLNDVSNMVSGRKGGQESSDRKGEQEQLQEKKPLEGMAREEMPREENSEASSKS